MKFKIADIKPNPFRDLTRYPLNEEKLAILQESVNETGFWGNIVARMNDGEAEIAYGHHRMEVLHRTYPGTHEIDLIVRDLDDEAMLKMMVRENAEVYGTTSALVDQETVRAVVEAYGAGQIELEQPAAKAPHLRYAPSFALGSEVVDGRLRLPYTSNTVAAFLGWNVKSSSGSGNDKVNDTLAALEFIKAGVLTDDHFRGMGTRQAHDVIVQCRQAIREAEARDRAIQAAEEHARSQEAALSAQAVTKPAPTPKKAITSGNSAAKSVLAIAKAGAKALKDGKSPGAAAKAKAKELAAKTTPKPDINVVAKQVSDTVSKVLDPHQNRNLVDQLNNLITARSAMRDGMREELAATLELVAERCLAKADALREEGTT